MSNHRSHGRPTPSRGARVEQRKAGRGTKKPATRMAIPDAIRALRTADQQNAGGGGG